MKKISYKNLFWLLLNGFVSIWCILELLTDNFGAGNPSTVTCVIILLLDVGYIFILISERRKKK